MSARPTPETDAAELTESETRWGVKPQKWPLVRSEFARRLERQRDELAEALRELVRLKDLHDAIEAHDFATWDGYRAAVEHYRMFKPKAWEAAHSILARIDAEKEPTDAR